MPPPVEPSELCEAILNASPDPILLIAQSGTIVVASGRVEAVLGWSASELVGENVDRLVPDHVRGSHAAQREQYGLRPTVREMGARRILEAVRKDGTQVPVEVSLSPFVLNGQPHTVVVLRDVTERRAIERELRYLGTHDALTGVYNRAFFEAEVERLAMSRHPTSVIMIDLDGLKEVNDNYGHAEGDRLLERTATALRASFRKEDVVARIGGDEFAVLLPGVDGEGLRLAVRRLLDDVGRMNDVHGGRPVIFSLGGGTATTPGSLEQTIRVADRQMYQQKRERGRGRSRP